MAEASAASQTAQLLSLLAGLPKTLFGSKQSTTVSGGGITEQTMFSDEAMAGLLKSILEGTDGKAGLASVAAGQKIPGLYNSTSKNLLVNDFTTRAASRVAELGAPKVTTKQPTTTTVKTPGAVSGKSGVGLGLGAAALLAGNKKVRKGASNIIDEMFGGGSAVTGAPGIGDLSQVLSGSDVFGPVSDNASALITGGFDQLNSIFSGGDALSNFSAGADAVSSASSFADFTNSIDGISSAFDAFGSASDISSIYDAADAAQGLELFGATDGIGLAGFGDLLRGDYADAATSAAVAYFGGPIGATFVAADSLLGTDITGKVGDKVFDDILGITDGKVICTELMRQGKLSKHLYFAEAKTNLARLSATTLRGYHAIAIPVVQRMRKSEALSNFLLPWVVDYSASVLGNSNGLRGKFVRYLLEPVCFLVGLCVPRQDYKSLYAAGA